ncbi:maleylpyruvate isomerase family mycothiol-dependent enzyme [Winogradskya humida]|uniref:Maleylpyruvate isomerase family mycothiol-dependent enzyme n=1 Tax=Winogradskya humida TaxID=113566 RepID=A0ABQ3ZHA7_9ACTN|nr:maleylpyruvate isomerase family mycothiol-dependent enzyme [Actinoplanes humidus]GIE17986.1 hypothetical protein Ahu01nite_010880 [Actinoplanes humidus]
MDTTLDFTDLLRLIDERSTAFRAAIAAAPSLDTPVPTCPGWTLSDLAKHIGEGRYAWAATVAAGPDATAKATGNGPAVPSDREQLLAWLADATEQLLDALREAGPDRGCWVWWGGSQSPKTCFAVARHQLQEISVHTYDAQLTVGAPQPLPDDVALDGIEEFQFTCVATPSPWPHKPAILDYHATEGRSWRLHFSADGARATIGTEPAPADVSARGTASDLVLFCYGRNSIDDVEITGDRTVFEQLIAWDPSV